MRSYEEVQAHVDDLLRRTRDERGMPRQVEDQPTIDKVAAILRGVRSINIWGSR